MVRISPVLSAMTASIFTPRSIPTATSGRATGSRSRLTSAWNETNQRPRSCRTVADRIRAVPARTRVRSFTVGSWVRIVPSRGRVT
jgi:hypothetical protein